MEGWRAGGLEGWSAPFPTNLITPYGWEVSHTRPCCHADAGSNESGWAERTQAAASARSLLHHLQSTVSRAPSGGSWDKLRGGMAGHVEAAAKTCNRRNRHKAPALVVERLHSVIKPVGVRVSLRLCSTDPTEVLRAGRFKTWKAAASAAKKLGYDLLIGSANDHGPCTCCEQ